MTKITELSRALYIISHYNVCQYDKSYMLIVTIVSDICHFSYLTLVLICTFFSLHHSEYQLLQPEHSFDYYLELDMSVESFIFSS
jgi:hypothetical protein